MSLAIERPPDTVRAVNPQIGMGDKEGVGGGENWEGEATVISQYLSLSHS